MPFFSIIIPAYNNAKYLFDCFNSIASQSFQDWEAIVVSDGSTDDSERIIAERAAADARFIPIINKTNKGRHLARISGVCKATGEYFMFLDADDEIEDGALEKIHNVLKTTPCEILHFGINIVGDQSIADETRTKFEEHANTPFPLLLQPDLMRLVFSETGGYKRDWRITQRAFSRQIAKEAFSKMTGTRLDIAEDGYEYFILASLASCETTDNNIIGYRYNLGRGITNQQKLTTDEYLEIAAKYKAAWCATFEFVEASGDKQLMSLAKGFEAKLIEALTNDWHERVFAEDKISSAHGLTNIIGPLNTAAELMRFARDEAYEIWTTDGHLSSDASLLGWFNLAEQLAATCPQQTGRYRQLSQAATNHINDLRTRERIKLWQSQPIRLFISTHKEVDLFDSLILQPIQVGSANAECRFTYMLHDDVGDHISNLNAQYCELTAQYWAWKNVHAEYYGFCHYRRYFNFSSIIYEENAFGEVVESYLDEAAQAKYALDDESIKKCITGFDVITTQFKDLRKFPGKSHTPIEQYEAAPYLHIEDMYRILAILEDMHPEYKHDIKTFTQGHFACFCNMFIMKKSVFNEYCSWLFPILERFVESTDTENYSREALRTPGHLSERLFNIYYLHNMRCGKDWKTKQLQCVRFEKPEKQRSIEPLSINTVANQPTIPIAFASDDRYVPMLTTTIYSMLRNASSSYHYAIAILEKNISNHNKQCMIEFFSRFENATIRFVNVAGSINKFNLNTNNEHISVETYYRFFIQEIFSFYDKALYLDSDLIVEGDIAHLYETELGGNLVAAVRDIDFLGNLNMKDNHRLDYNDKILHMQNPYNYFQAVVLLLNTSAMRNLHSIDKWLEIASNPAYIYNDQDVLNVHCEGRTVYIEDSWNVMTDCFNRVTNVFSFAPAKEFDNYLEARKHPKIIHYAGFEKPWNTRNCDLCEFYWKYARNTPFYEALLSARTGLAPVEDNHESAIAEDNFLRKLFDPILPAGSRRREATKAVARKILGKK